MSISVPELNKSEQELETERFIERCKSNPVLFQSLILDRTLKTFQKQALLAPKVIREDRLVSLKLLSRDSGKSWTETIGGSIFEVCKDPDTSIQIIAESQTTAKLFLTEIKLQLERNEKIHKYFGKHKPTDRITPWSKTEIVSALRTTIQKEPTIEVFGANGAIVGRHVKVQKLDDISTLKTAATPDKRQKIIQWYHSVVKYCLNKGGNLDIAGTRYFPGDFYEHLITIWGLGILFRVPALQLVEPQVIERFDDDKFELSWSGAIDNGDACDALIKEPVVERSFFPERVDVGTLFEERRNDPVSFSHQRQNDVTITQSQFIEGDKMIVIDDDKLPPLNEMLSYIAADPATGTKRNHDRFACTISAFHPPTGLIYTFWNDASRYGDTISMLDHLKKLYYYVVSERNGSVACCAIESNAFQKVLAQTVEKMRKEYGMLPVQQLFTLTDKEQRFVSLAWLVNSGRCRFTKQCARLIEDILRFPNVDQDDRVDSWMLNMESIIKTQVMTKAFKVNIRDMDEHKARFFSL